MRVLPKLGKEIVEQIEEAWRLPQEDWARKRLLVVRLIAQHEHTVAEIMKIASVCRQTGFTYRDKVVAEGVSGLLKREWSGARRPTVRGAVADEFLDRLGQGEFRQARDAQSWIKKRTRKTLTESGVRKTIRRLGGKLKVPRKSHVKKDPEVAQKFRADLSQRLDKAVGTSPDKAVRIWVLDEHRYGLLPVIRRVWGRKGVRVHAPYKTTYQWGYLHEALEVDGQHKVELLFTPMINQDAHAVFLKQIAVSDPQAIRRQWHDPHAGGNGWILLLHMEAGLIHDHHVEGSDLNPAEWFGRVVKAPTVNRIYQNLKSLENHIIAVERRWSDPAKVATLIHEWMRVEVNAIAKTKSLLAR